jgi:hypothetical protein
MKRTLTIQEGRLAAASRPDDEIDTSLLENHIVFDVQPERLM